jgi:hypothetical protein
MDQKKEIFFGKRPHQGMGLRMVQDFRDAFIRRQSQDSSPVPGQFGQALYMGLLEFSIFGYMSHRYAHPI